MGPDPKVAKNSRASSECERSDKIYIPGICTHFSFKELFIPEEAFQKRHSSAANPESESSPCSCRYFAAKSSDFHSRVAALIVKDTPASGKAPRRLPAAPSGSHTLRGDLLSPRTGRPPPKPAGGLLSPRTGGLPSNRPPLELAGGRPTHQPGLRDLRQRHLGRGRQAAGGLLLRSVVSHFRTCRDQPNTGRVRRTALTSSAPEDSSQTPPCRAGGIPLHLTDGEPLAGKG